MHVAFSLLALYALFNDVLNVSYGLFLVSSTILSYNMIRLFSFRTNRFFIKKFVLKHKYWFIGIIILSLITSLYTFVNFTGFIKLLLLPFFGLTLFYNLNFKFFPFSQLRNNGVVKIIVVALVWTGLTVFIPQFLSIYHSGNYLSTCLACIFVFIYIIMLTMSFDQRDLLIDNSNLRTLPQLYSKYLIYFYIVFNTIMTLIAYVYTDSLFAFSIYIFMINLSVFLCYKSTEHKNFYYTAFWIEGLPILWYFLQLIA
jgi:hypothetical protein